VQRGTLAQPLANDALLHTFRDPEKALLQGLSRRSGREEERTTGIEPATLSLGS
jgi:hypothetical protein